MRFIKTELDGVTIIEQFHFEDHRGSFVKTFHEPKFKEAGIDFELKESFYSLSKKDVIRGMHYHLPPHDHAKIVFCTSGSILDVAVDIRKDSPTFGKYIQVELSLRAANALYIPKGFAHGFLSLCDDACVHYLVSGPYDAASDAGYLYNSFGMQWPVTEPILSERDLSFPQLL